MGFTSNIVDIPDESEDIQSPQNITINVPSMSGDLDIQAPLPVGDKTSQERRKSNSQKSERGRLKTLPAVQMVGTQGILGGEKQDGTTNNSSMPRSPRDVESLRKSITMAGGFSGAVPGRNDGGGGQNFAE